MHNNSNEMQSYNYSIKFEESPLGSLSAKAQVGIVGGFVGVFVLVIGDVALGLEWWTLFPEIGGIVLTVLGTKYYLRKHNINLMECLKKLNWDALLPGYEPPVVEGSIVEEGQPKDEPQEMQPDEEIEQPQEDKLEAPTALELLTSGSIGADILLGYGKDGNEIRRTWKQLKAILILGLQGGGKTTSAVWLMGQALMQGARLAVIDKHAKSEEDSMMQKIEPFTAFFDCSPGVDPASALQVVRHVRNVFEARENGAKCDYPLLFVVDEFSAIMGKINKDGHKWQETAKALADLVEELNQEGRKHKIYAVCIGQVTNASRSGGTEIRDLFNTRIVHGMRVKQAQMLSLSENVKDIRALDQGQVIVDMEGRDEPFFVQVPYLSDEDIKALASFLHADALPVGENAIMDAVITALKHLDKKDLVNLIEQMPDRQEEEYDPLTEQEQRYEDALKAWESGAKSIRSMRDALGLNFNQARELLEEMDGLGLITWKNRDEFEAV